MAFSNTHCDVLEEKSASVAERIEVLKQQLDEDALLFEQEKEQVKEAYARLDALYKSAELIETKTASILPTLLEREKVYAGQLQEIQNIAKLTLVPEQVTELKRALLGSMLKLTVVSRELDAVFQTFETRGEVCSL